MIGSIVACLLAAVAPTASVDNLRCEYLVDPIGIDSTEPRLSWNIEYPGRDWQQSAYRITVGSSPSKVGLWDTGKVASTQSIQIPYAGKALTSGEECFWRVETWDQFGFKSKWSRTGRWQMGLLGEEAWQNALWLGGENQDTPAPAPLLLRKFSVEGRVQKATLYACGLGYAELHLNGRKLGDLTERDPGYTNFDKRVLYVAHDVTKLVKPGANAVGAILGTGWYDVHDRATWRFDRAPWRGRPRLRLLLVMTFSDGRRQVVKTDGDWKSTESPIRFDGIYTGEVYDARLEVPNWDTTTAKDQDWPSAKELPAPKGILVWRGCPAVAITQSFAPKEIKEPKPGVYIVDFGQNLSGHVQLMVNEPAGTKITMRYSERIGKDGMIDRSQIEQFMAKTNPPQPFQTDTYICKGGGMETWEQRFSYSGFRYAEVTGFPNKPSKDNFRARFAHTDFESAGGFTCSNDLLNKIQEATRYSYLSNAQSIPTDCPQREKNGWTGDAQLAAEAGLMNFDSASFYTKWLNDFADTQAQNGRVSIIVPTGGWGAGSFNPAWDSAYPIVAADLYHYCGDTRVLAENYDHMRRYVDALAAETKDGVIPFDSLGDWVPWKTETPSQFTSTCYLYLDAKLLVQAATLIGRPDDVAKYTELAEKTKDAFNTKFYDPEKKVYANGSQTASSTALYFGLVPEERKAETFAALVADVERQGHIDTGIIGAKNVLRVLSEGGRTDLAYRLVARKAQPGWGWWIEQGATTLWEDWKGESSLNHIMFGDVSNWFIQWIEGISVDNDSPGFSHVIIRPQPVGDLTSASAWHQTPHGRIESSWTLKDHTFTLKLTIPANVRASVWVPGTQASGSGLVRKESGEALFEVGSGSYEFESTD